MQLRALIACVALVMAVAVRADPPAAPTGVYAAIVSATSVRITWDAVAGADSYDVRRDGTPIGSSTTNSYSDNAVPMGVHFYTVRAVSAGGTSAWSASGMTAAFTEEPLIPRLTRIKATHVLQLRDAINAMRTAAMLSQTTFTDASLTGVKIKAVHVNELRSALDGARSALALPSLTYTHPIAANTTPIRTVDLMELRGGVTSRPPETLFWDGLTAAAAQSIACNASSLFAGAPGFVRRSSDGGTTWNDSTGLPSGENVVAIVNGGDGFIFAQLANTKLYRSTNHGATFSELTTTPASFTSFAGARNGLFAVGGACASVWFSSDGASWSPRNSGISGCVTALARTNRGRLYAGTAANGVFTSANDGVSWSAVGAGIPANSIRAIATDRDQRIFVAAASQGIYRSTNDGSTWASMRSGDFASLIVDSTGALVAGTQSGARMHTSSDGGATWLVSSRGLPLSGAIGALCSTHRHRFARLGGNLFRGSVELHLHGLNFSPILDGQTDGTIVGAPQILQRMQIVSPYTRWIRSFRVSNGQQYTARVARTLGLKTLIGAAITANLQQNQQELAALIEIGRSGDADILAVGNEVLLNNLLPASTLASYVQQVKAAVPGVPVTYVDGFHICLDDANASVCNAVDVISANIYPFWDPNGIGINDAIGYVDTNMQLLRAKMPAKPILVSEAGWPTAGRADATPTNAAQHFREFETWARATGASAFWFAAFDEDWKFAVEGGPGPHWGVWDENGVIKPSLAPMIAGEWSGDEVLGGPGTAAIDFDLPDYVNDFTVRGTVQHVVPNDSRVAVLIRVGGVWWTKPYENARTMWVRGNGVWSALVKTHPNDANATEVAAYLLPAWYTPPFVAGAAAVPPEIASNALASHSETR